MIKIVRSTVKVGKGANALRKEYVRRYKLEEIGEGAFARTYSNGNPRTRTVYKIGIVEGDSFKEDAYCQYLERVVLPNQSNPLMPRIYGVQYVTLKVHDKFGYRFEQRVYVVTMERLNHWTTVSTKIARVKLKQYGLQDHSDIDMLELEDLESEREVRKILRNDTTGHFRAVAGSIRRLMRHPNNGADCHNDNVMWRGKGTKAQMVITDPVA